MNAAGKALRAAKVPLAQLDEETVCRAAMRQTRLADFGDAHYQAGLRRLLELAEQDAHLHFVGRLGLHQMIVDNLATRLLLMEARKRTPHVFEQPLIPH